MLQYLPNEIVLLIFENLIDTQSDIVQVLSTNHFFRSIITDDSFWHDLIHRRYGVKYIEPNQTWFGLFLSGDASKMCSHMSTCLLSQLEQKRDQLWAALCAHPSSICCSNMKFENYGMCLEPGCSFVGCGDTFFQNDESCSGHLQEHHQKEGHNLVLKLSPLSFMEIWCYGCNSPVGFWEFPLKEKPRSERYMCRNILRHMSQLPNMEGPVRKQIVKKRRWVEQRLTMFQQTHDCTYLIEKSWFTKWIDFLIGKSHELPGELDNEKLFYNDKKTLRHDLIIGHDYELVGGSIRTFIERVYGLANDTKIVSGDDFSGQPTYRGISHSVLLHRHYAVHQ